MAPADHGTNLLLKASPFNAPGLQVIARQQPPNVFFRSFFHSLLHPRRTCRAWKEDSAVKSFSKLKRNHITFLHEISALVSKSDYPAIMEKCKKRCVWINQQVKKYAASEELYKELSKQFGTVLLIEGYASFNSDSATQAFGRFLQAAKTRPKNLYVKEFFDQMSDTVLSCLSNEITVSDEKQFTRHIGEKLIPAAIFWGKNVLAFDSRRVSAIIEAQFSSPVQNYSLSYENPLAFEKDTAHIKSFSATLQKLIELKTMLAELDLTKQNALLVTDSILEVNAAKWVGMTSVYVNKSGNAQEADMFKPLAELILGLHVGEHVELIF